MTSVSDSVVASGLAIAQVYALDADPAWLPLQSVQSFDAVLADVRWPEGARCLLDAARAASVPTVFDGDVGAPDALRDLSGRCDYAIFSTPGLALATGTRDPAEGLRCALGFTTAVIS